MSGIHYHMTNKEIETNVQGIVTLAQDFVVAVGSQDRSRIQQEIIDLTTQLVAQFLIDIHRIADAAEYLSGKK